MNNAVFRVLTGYSSGSDRASLLPIDTLVNQAAADRDLRKEIERQLLQALADSQSPEAKEYICSKLTLIGSAAAAPAVAPLLADPRLSTAARNVLQALPTETASKALRRSLSTLSGANKVGVINSLGERRDESSVSLLAKLLLDSDPQLAQAAAAALGRIGTRKSGKVLAKSQLKAVGTMRSVIVDAGLACAESLSLDGKKKDADALLHAMEGPGIPGHLNRALKAALARQSTPVLREGRPVQT